MPCAGVEEEAAAEDEDMPKVVLLSCKSERRCIGAEAATAFNRSGAEMATAVHSMLGLSLTPCFLRNGMYCKASLNARCMTRILTGV